MNVLVLMSDHHRFDALGCLANPLSHTPNLDRLAEQSVRFEVCYNQSPVCSPALHSLATGRYAHAHGVLTNSSMPYPDVYDCTRVAVFGLSAGSFGTYALERSQCG